jgi:hypothetical protein
MTVDYGPSQGYSHSDVPRAERGEFMAEGSCGASINFRIVATASIL